MLELRRSSVEPPEGTRATPETHPRHPAASYRRRLLCGICGAPVTTEAAAVTISGSPLHRRTNPSGIAFTFACFTDAPGALTTGEPTAEHTWFPGYSWSFARCLGCGEHLGWHFQGGVPTFFALILAKLAPEGFTPRTSS